MRNFLKNNGLWILFAGAVISVALALMSYFSATSAPLVNAVNVLVSPFRSAYTAVATWFNDKQNYYRDTTALLDENAALRKRVAELEADLRQAADDSKENEILRDALELRKQRRELELESAMITERSVTNWTSSLTLNKGTSHGVESGDAVIDGTGSLVGVVREVGLNWCTVLTVVDTDTSLGAQVFRTKDLALAVGNFALMEAAAGASARRMSAADGRPGADLGSWRVLSLGPGHRHSGGDPGGRLRRRLLRHFDSRGGPLLPD